MTRFMRRVVSASIVAFALLAISAIVPTLAQATPFVSGGGWFDGSIPETTVEVSTAGGNTLVHVAGGGGRIGGTFLGTWTHEEWDVIHPTGSVTLHGLNTMTVTLDVGGSGTVFIVYEGIADAATGVFNGRFVIAGGSGDLSTIRGIGLVWVDASGAGGYTVSYRLGG